MEHSSRSLILQYFCSFQLNNNGHTKPHFKIKLFLNVCDGIGNGESRSEAITDTEEGKNSGIYKQFVIFQLKRKYQKISRWGLNVQFNRPVTLKIVKSHNRLAVTIM